MAKGIQKMAKGIQNMAGDTKCGRPLAMRKCFQANWRFFFLLLDTWLDRDQAV